MPQPVGTLEEQLEKVQAAILILERVAGIEIPRTIRDAAFGNFNAVVESMTEGLVRKASDDDVKSIKGRVVTIEYANFILYTLETETVRLFVESSKGTAQVAFRTIKEKWRFLVQQLPILLLVIAPFVKKILEGAPAALNASLYSYSSDIIGALYYITGNFDKFDNRERLAEARELLESYLRIPSEIVAALLSRSAAFALADVVALYATKEQYQKAVEPINALSNLVFKELSRNLLPQRNARRFRKRKRTRK